MRPGAVARRELARLRVELAASQERIAELERLVRDQGAVIQAYVLDAQEQEAPKDA